ncbi:MAG: DUF4342 domain-containing protein [Clostridiales Family XIII bacterium]|jgi:NACalpha-BTF3-like transcription factor|nr:DUF4342 domain-containing protein [Clostridiales Family XIII bacterium]
MDVTLEKIELVKDRTGVSYKEAKEALERTDCNVVDAIIDIEESINLSGRKKFGAQIGARGSQLIEKVKAVVKKGNVSKIIVKKENEIILNLPVSVGLVGTLLAPWVALAGVVAAFGSKCVIEVVKDDGQIVEISEIANEAFSDAIDKGADFVGDVKEKGADVISGVMMKAQESLNRVKSGERADSEKDAEDSESDVIEENDEE